MILFIREYTAGNGSEKNYDVIHEKNGRRRWYYYTGNPPKTVLNFIKGKIPEPYNNKTLKEKGYIYK